MIRSSALTLTLCALSLAASAPARGEAATAPPGAADPWIERMNDALLPADSMTAKVELVTADGYGSPSRIEFDYTRTTAPGGLDQTLIEVTAPEEGKGSVYQISVRPGEAFEGWIWSPALDLLRRIEGIHRTDAFLGSEFTYEDIGLAAPLERRSGDVNEVTEDGRSWIRLESGPYHYYGRVQTYLDPETGLPHKVVFYDRAGQRFRVQRFLEIREFDGHPFPTVQEIEDRLTGTTSRLTFSDVRFGVEVPATVFSKSAIRKRLEQME